MTRVLPAILALMAIVGWTQSADAQRSRAAKAKSAQASKAKASKARAAKAEADRAAAKAVAVRIRAQADGQVGRFYAGRGFWPLWASTGRIGPEADALLGYLATAELDGLKPSNYDVSDLRRDVAAARAGEPAAVARAELALSRSFARYVGDARRPTKVKVTWLDQRLRPRKLKADAVLRAATLPKSFRDYVTSMGWMSPHYVKLRMAMAHAGTDEAQRKVRLNLDRARMLPGPWTHHIVVDAASARLWWYQAGKQQGTMRVVVGTRQTQTPMLAGMVQYAILNPYWNVPVDLARTNIAPKVMAGRSLAAMRFEALSDWSASARKLSPAEIDWRAVASGDRELRVRQLPGGSNSMGRVKFMFPNEQGIYLHDTPDRKLFARADRHLSNGCVRLEDAPKLGRWLLGKPITAASKRPEQDVALPVPVPVYLTYLTAAPGEGGVRFVGDAYGRDF